MSIEALREKYKNIANRMTLLKPSEMGGLGGEGPKLLFAFGDSAIEGRILLDPDPNKQTPFYYLYRHSLPGQGARICTGANCRICKMVEEVEKETGLDLWRLKAKYTIMFWMQVASAEDVKPNSLAVVVGGFKLARAIDKLIEMMEEKPRRLELFKQSLNPLEEGPARIRIDVTGNNDVNVMLLTDEDPMPPAEVDEETFIPLEKVWSSLHSPVDYDLLAACLEEIRLKGYYPKSFDALKKAEEEGNENRGENAPEEPSAPPPPPSDKPSASSGKENKPEVSGTETDDKPECFGRFKVVPECLACTFDKECRKATAAT